MLCSDDMIASMQQTKGVLRDMQVRQAPVDYIMTEGRRGTIAFGRIVKMYYCPCQVKVSCFGFPFFLVRIGGKEPSPSPGHWNQDPLPRQGRKLTKS